MIDRSFMRGKVYACRNHATVVSLMLRLFGCIPSSRSNSKLLNTGLNFRVVHYLTRVVELL